MQIGKARHLKICEELVKIKSEDSRGLIRHYRGRNYVSKFQDILYGSKYPKRWRNMRPGAHIALSCAWYMFSCTWVHEEVHGAWVSTPGAKKHTHMLLYCDFLVQKARYFIPSSDGNSPTKYRIPHSQFLIQNEEFQEEGKH